MVKIAKVDFYQLSPNTNQHERNLFLCKLIEKVYLRKHKLYIHCQDQQEANQIDELLWTYKDTSFIPHNLLGEGPSEAPPVQLGFDKTPTHNDVLINLATEIPEFHTRFKRILEIAINSDDVSDTASHQEHLIYYQQQNFDISTHTINQEKKAHSHG